jgi:RNA polymerase sigma-70 factor (ECF subfamily)
MNAMFFRRQQPGFDASFAEIVRTNQAMVYSIGWHLLRDMAAAEELAQDVFLALYENLGSLESRAHVVNWLRRAMTHRSIDYSRRSRLRPRLGLESVQEPAGPSSDSDPLMSGHLESLIARLPERARQIVVLRYQEDLEPTEIAELLGLSVGAVKSNLHRSLAWMRGRMERMGVTK